MMGSNGKGKHVTIIGGGITGLSAAWYLQQAAQKQDLPVEYTLLEQSDRWGGKIKTIEEPGFGKSPFVVEAGPDSFITQKPWAHQLAVELGLEPELLPTSGTKRKVFVLHRERPVPLPEGVMLIVPTKLRPFLFSPLISLPGKLRMGLDLLVWPKKDEEDETLADFVLRRLGREALDKIAEPLMSGIYNAEAEKQSIMATFPRFRAIEAKYGSLIRGMLAGQKARRAQPPSPKKPLTMFISFREGMQTLVKRLQGSLHGDLRLHTSVEAISHDAASTVSASRYRVTLSNGDSFLTDAVILAVPAYIAAGLLKEIAPQVAQELQAIRYVSTGTISLSFRREDIGRPLDGVGLVIPRSAGRTINAVTWTSNKFENRAPEGYDLLRVFFGGSRRPEMMEKDDDELEDIVRRELLQLLDIDAEPIFRHIYRWRQANPQYDVGHLERVASIETGLPSGVFVSGSPYRGIGIPDCVHQAQLTVEQLVEHWSVTSRQGQPIVSATPN